MDAGSQRQKKIATVILSNHIKPHAIDQFASYQREPTERVKEFEGFFGTESFPPDPSVQPEWVIIYRFKDIELLKKWLDSPKRKEISEQMDLLLEKPCHMQVLVDADTDAVTNVYTHRIKKGCEEQYRAWRAKMHEAEKQVDGYLGVESYDPFDGVTDEWVDIARFSDAEKLDKWIASPQRAALLKEQDPILEDLSIKRVSFGLDAWFHHDASSDAAPPPSWKQAMAV